MAPRVLLVADRFPPFDKGGAARAVYYDAMALRDAGFHVGVFTGRESGASPTSCSEPGLEVFRPFILGDDLPPGLSHLPAKALTAARALRRPPLEAALKIVAETFRPDLVHAHFVPEISFSAVGECRNDVPKVMTFQGFLFECPKGSLLRRSGVVCERKPLPCRIFTSLASRQLAGIDRLVATSHFMERRLLAAGHSRDRVTYLPTGFPHVEERPYRPPRQPKLVLFVGLIEVAKGVRDLVSAFKAVNDEKASLVIIGDGRDMDAVRRLAATDRRIHLRGRLQHDDVMRHYPDAQLVIVPSRFHEIMNTVICEAHSFGRPVVASRVGGNEELIEDTVNGALFRPGNVSELRDILEGMLADPRKCEQMGLAGRASVARFGMRRHTEDLLRLYERLGVSLGGG